MSQDVARCIGQPLAGKQCERVTHYNRGSSKHISSSRSTNHTGCMLPTECMQCNRVLITKEQQREEGAYHQRINMEVIGGRKYQA